MRRVEEVHGNTVVPVAGPDGRARTDARTHAHHHRAPLRVDCRRRRRRV